MRTWTREELRRPARIASVFRGKEDHGVFTVSIGLNGQTWGQSFGNLCLRDDAEARQFVWEVCDVFGLADPERLVGQACVALYSESPWSTIEGIEAPSGRRFTIKGYRRRHYPDQALTPTEERRARLVSMIASHERRLAEYRAELATLGTLVDWDDGGVAPAAETGKEPER
jgi:hypothetical protein